MKLSEFSRLFEEDTPQEFVTRNLHGLATLMDDLEPDRRELARVSLWIVARHLENPARTIEELLDGVFKEDLH